MRHTTAQDRPLKPTLLAQWRGQKRGKSDSTNEKEVKTVSNIDLSKIPQEVKDLAENLGVKIEDVIASMAAAGGAQAEAAAQIQQQPGVAEPIAATDLTPPAASEGTSPEVRVVPTETNEERLEKERAILQQELQQTRANLQTMSAGRVVGSGGQSGPVVDTVPNLGGIEPGLRYAVRNGLVKAEDVIDKVGPVLVELLKRDLGGII